MSCEDWDDEVSKKYVFNDGTLCPFCGSGEIEGDGPMEMTRCLVYQKIKCHACGATWDDNYVLRGIDDLRPGDDPEPEEDEDDLNCLDCSNQNPHADSCETCVPQDPQDDPPLPAWPEENEDES